MTTTMAVQPTASQSNNRASLFLRLADVEKERENILRRLGLTDASLTVMPSTEPLADMEAMMAIEVLTSRVVKLEAKIFASKLEGQAMIKSNGNGHSNGESHHEPTTSDELLAKRAAELGCPVEWLFIQERGGRKCALLRRGKGDEVKKLQRAAIKESGKTPDEAAGEALKLDGESFMQWVRGAGRTLIESKRLISKEMRVKLVEKIKEIKSA